MNRSGIALRLLAVLAALTAVLGCGKDASPVSKAPSPDSWLRGSTEDKLEQLAKHHRGFDVAMVETGYRYNELYFAGKEKNWKYAKYLTDKIKLTIENGYERRAKRKPNAEALFLNTSFKEMVAVIDKEDASRFDTAFQNLTTGCNKCHEAEQMAFIKVATPQQRQAALGP